MLCLSFMQVRASASKESLGNYCCCYILGACERSPDPNRVILPHLIYRSTAYSAIRLVMCNYHDSICVCRPLRRQSRESLGKFCQNYDIIIKAIHFR